MKSIKEAARVSMITKRLFASKMPGRFEGKFYNDMGANRSSIPIGFAGRPEHIAKTIAFLADRDSSEYIIGQNIVADGGTTLVLGIHANVLNSLSNSSFKK
ncbi:Protein CBG22607 [Caenorhabditis briggsae]|uniref:Protein CBG22607 n=1 Tax=Caenorhabditis briggsae TaxID=6238 RepID=A8Y2N5_CAEBR|nr:Protein CBG22607 [Caenorhabditis briggsae]CAP39160.2 Protein CBG22607 [Caenorhabditis briggsae]